MKIALVIERLDATRGGRETSTSQIASALTAAGHRVSVLCQQGQSPDASVAIERIRARGLSRWERLTKFSRAVAEEVTRQKYDIVHAMLPLPCATVYQLRGGTVPGIAAANRRRRGKLVGGLMEAGNVFNWHRLQMGKMERVVMADAGKLVLPVSHMVADEVRKYYGRTENVRVIFNAVAAPPADDAQRQAWRAEIRAKLGLAEGDLAFLTVAKNYKLKGIAETIEAFAQWRKQHDVPNAKLIVVGREDSQVKAYHRLAQRSGVGKAVTFAGTQDEIFRWYAAVDVCVLLSWYDPCSRVVLEATRWGIPSITTVFNGAAEILATGRCGVAVSAPNDLHGVVAAMRKLADRRTRMEMSQACEAVERQLSMQRHVNELCEAYEQLLSRK